MKVVCEYCGEIFEKHLNEQCCPRCFLKADKINKSIINGTFREPDIKLDLFETIYQNS